MKSIHLAIALWLITFIASGQSNAVDDKIVVDINGVQQTILVRGNSSANPVLLVLHGGPGFADGMFFRSFNTDLEKDFLLVNWDQRGAHHSYNDSIPVESMTIEQFVRDGKMVTDLLKTRYQKDRIFMLGHSWGTVLGIHLADRFPADYHAYISVNPLANAIENEKLSIAYTLQEAERRGNKEALKELKEIAARYPHSSEDLVGDLKAQRRWLEVFGGVFYGGKQYDYLFDNISPTEKEYYHADKMNQGQTFSLAILWQEIIHVNFFETIPELKIPVYFMVGKHDYNTPYQITVDYYNFVKAKKKKLYCFEKSGHFIPYEEPDRFHETMREILRDSLNR